MGNPDAPPLNRRVLLQALTAHQVEFVLVGGQAAASYGAERISTDLDICVLHTTTNLARVAEALQSVGAKLRHGADIVEGIQADAAFLDRMELSTWRSDAGDVDVLLFVPGADRRHVNYEELLQRANRLTVDGVAVEVASLDDVIASKETTNRPPDHEALPELRSLRERREVEGAAAPDASLDPPPGPGVLGPDDGLSI
ncbi:MAG: hypothetical protein JWM47_1778 [Acidimicrobiales bacterium]|nr:hypothetical protein [Acidimicrobiales bacterium]